VEVGRGNSVDASGLMSVRASVDTAIDTDAQRSTVQARCSAGISFSSVVPASVSDDAAVAGTTMDSLSLCGIISVSTVTGSATFASAMLVSNIGTVDATTVTEVPRPSTPSAWGAAVGEAAIIATTASGSPVPASGSDATALDTFSRYCIRRERVGYHRGRYPARDGHALARLDCTEAVAGWVAIEDSESATIGSLFGAVETMSSTENAGADCKTSG